jgi:hypothetical protein
LRGHAESIEQPGEERIGPFVVHHKANIQEPWSSDIVDLDGVSMSAQLGPSLEDSDLMTRVEGPSGDQSRHPGPDDRDTHLAVTPSGTSFIEAHILCPYLRLAQTNQTPR